eukprot:CAMPEP_0170609422 /NCGR_PEP_ID=MMETSP0224-20130122/22120_1 /TAXON_ID=285029 /ORGANISM="Togula jolla, Strain CCCM 725" /LENGTH=74 /DNA_ID=CAMNT_0010934735 /DNA_START=151 /DNA_END=374 /DNA_ORIENTATION=+
MSSVATGSNMAIPPSSSSPSRILSATWTLGDSRLKTMADSWTAELGLSSESQSALSWKDLAAVEVTPVILRNGR